ncbi:hypothetical protein LCGC14_3026940, partial [marine sediment metagenome]
MVESKVGAILGRLMTTGPVGGEVGVWKGKTARRLL